jgi:hypothetical protein
MVRVRFDIKVNSIEWYGSSKYVWIGKRVAYREEHSPVQF